jgi:predicted house-cleaning NTP pyrophosphatase (Maf/HAM1 superfamily)
MQQIILASQSPRRRELLATMGVDFDVAKPVLASLIT